jgi:hypothetical protein
VKKKLILIVTTTWNLNLRNLLPLTSESASRKKKPRPINTGRLNVSKLSTVKPEVRNLKTGDCKTSKPEEVQKQKEVTVKRKQPSRGRKVRYTHLTVRNRHLTLQAFVTNGQGIFQGCKRNWMTLRLSDRLTK